MTEYTKEIEVDLTDDEFLRVAKMAHERDITFNEMVNRILEWYIAELEEEERNGKSDN